MFDWKIFKTRLLSRFAIYFQFCIRIYIYIYIYIYWSNRLELQNTLTAGPVRWGCWIHRLHLCRGVKLSRRLSWIRQSDGKVPVMLELWGMQSTPLLPLLPGPLWPGVVAPDRVLSMGQIEINRVLMLSWIS